MESRVESNEDGSVSVNITVQQPLLLVQNGQAGVGTAL